MTRIPVRRLGSTNREVGAVGLGCMGMTWAYTTGQDPARSTEVVRHAVELGVTLIDTADMYGPFTNEELVGRALEGIRDDVVLASKGGLVVADAASLRIERDGRPEHLLTACDASLRRLGTDAIDLYYLHRIDPDVPVEETWGAMRSLVDAGKVRALGLSEANVDELARAHAIHPVAALQSELSLWTRAPLENGVLDWCRAHDCAFVPFAPLGRGFLTGSIATADFAADDFRSRNPRFTGEAVAANQAIVERVRGVAERHGATPAQVALAWTLAQSDLVVPIPGTKRLRYLEENAAAASLALTADDLAELDALPAAVGSRYA